MTAPNLSVLQSTSFVKISAEKLLSLTENELEPLFDPVVKAWMGSVLNWVFCVRKVLDLPRPPPWTVRKIRLAFREARKLETLGYTIPSVEKWLDMLVEKIEMPPTLAKACLEKMAIEYRSWVNSNPGLPSLQDHLDVLVPSLVVRFGDALVTPAVLENHLIVTADDYSDSPFIVKNLAACIWKEWPLEKKEQTLMFLMEPELDVFW